MDWSPTSLVKRENLPLFCTAKQSTSSIFQRFIVLWAPDYARNIALWCVFPWFHFTTNYVSIRFPRSVGGYAKTLKVWRAKIKTKRNSPQTLYFSEFRRSGRAPLKGKGLTVRKRHKKKKNFRFCHTDAANQIDREWFLAFDTVLQKPSEIRRTQISFPTSAISARKNEKENLSSPLPGVTVRA